MSKPAEIQSGLFLISDICNVYAVQCDEEMVAIDFGSGRVLSCFDRRGSQRVGRVLATHHHRDQLQGLVDLGSSSPEIWVPEAESHLIGPGLNEHWQGRELLTNYNTREDRFSVRRPLPISGVLRDYESHAVSGRTFEVVPTPGHTTGSISLITEIEGMTVAFTGDLLQSDATIPSLSATQWNYDGAQGIVATIASLILLRDRGLDAVLPSHGPLIVEPDATIDELVSSLERLLRLRRDAPPLWSQQRSLSGGDRPGDPFAVRELAEEPFERISPHLLANRTAAANSFVLRSDSGKALVFDYGFDFCLWSDPAGWDRAKVRPWLYSLPALERSHGVSQVEVAIPTHYHDDHVAGLNVLRRVEGTEVWCSELFAEILARPLDFDLPCLWFDPIPADRVLPERCTVVWHEFELQIFPLHGHTFYAIAISILVDDIKVLVCGDQFAGPDGLGMPYVYRNGFRRNDYVRSSELLAEFEPDLILSGHEPPFFPPPEFAAEVRARGTELKELHEIILGRDSVEACRPYLARLRPYQSSIRPPGVIRLILEILSPFAVDRMVGAEIRLPPDWGVDPGKKEVLLPAMGAAEMAFEVDIPGPVEFSRREILTASVMLDGVEVGELVEAVVTVDPPA